MQKVGCRSWMHLIRSQHLNSTYATHINAEPFLRFRRMSHPAEGLFFRSNGKKFSAKPVLVQDFLAAERAVEDAINDPEYFKFTVVRHPWNRSAQLHILVSRFST